MKFKVNKAGIYTTSGPAMPGDVLDVKELPDSWKPFGEVVEETKKTDDKAAVTNPAKPAAEKAK